ncbi:hypothetical protein F5884DRAFT_753580 [Xylogone sp. PMI_703]|nr:hypothetical protein F5884DRAFT_753580 [Xylogone sp. PMI_703]
MSYHQASQTESSLNNPIASSMFLQADAYARRGSYGQAAPFLQGTTAFGKMENQLSNGLLNQFAGLSLSTNSVASTAPIPVTAGQLPPGPTQYFYTSSGQLVYAAPGMYGGPVSPISGYESSGGYASTMPFIQQANYPSYIPGYTLLPFTPQRTGLYTEGIDIHHKEASGLQNRRSSSSTNVSTPGTPFYPSLAQREQAAKIAGVDISPFGSTPSPNDTGIYPMLHRYTKPMQHTITKPNVDLDTLLQQHPAIPRAVPAVFTPRESMRTLDQSLSNPIPGNRNVYIRGLHPDTDDEMLAAYAARFGKVETSKAIIDTTTGACKGFGFAKYYDINDSKLCIHGFYKLGYEVGFARESFNSRLKAEGDENSTNLYVSNLPKDMSEAELGAVFMDYNVVSSRILRDSHGVSRGVGFARFDTREICEEIIKKFHGQPVGIEALPLQVRYADTPAQKDLKRITTERRQFRTNEYNIGAYGTLVGINNAVSPLLPRATQIAHHLPGSNSSEKWKGETTNSNDTLSGFKDIDQPALKATFISVTPPQNNKKGYNLLTPDLAF